MSVDASRDLLFGLLALQNGLIDQAQLVASFQAWTLEKRRPLAEHLAARGDLDAEDRDAVEALVARHLKKHGGSPSKSLAALPAARSMQGSLTGLGDVDLAASLAGLPVHDETDHAVAPGPMGANGDGVPTRPGSVTGVTAGFLSEETEVEVGHPAPERLRDVGRAGASAGRYHLLEEIARGGMGAVHRGRDVLLGRDLALKILLDRHRDRPDLVERFVDEAQICGQLQHPGVVPVYELGTLADDRPYFAMKLVKGRTLGDLLAEAGAGADLPRFLAIFESVCQTVAYAHARGVIHRDLKPDNVMVGAFGEVQVMDWGLAKVLARPGETPAPEPAPTGTIVATARSEGGSEHTQTGSVLGTPAYMAPEQARGDLESVDRRSDVFAMGSILCQILTGAPAFVGGSMREVLGRAGRADTADAMARLDACGADDDLRALARDCLAARADDRPADAGVVAGRMTAYLAGVQTRLRQAELARAAEAARAREAEAKATAERRVRRLVAALAATVVTAGLLGGAGWRRVELQRIERVRAAGERVNVALREATRLRGLAQAATVGDLGPWDVAAVAAEKARDLLDPGIEPSLRKQAEDLAAETASDRERAGAAARAARRDRDLLDRLVDIRSAEADDAGGFATDAAYAEVFREAGLDLSVMSPAGAAKIMEGRPADVVTAMAGALDDWASVTRKARKDTGGAALSAMAGAIDPDPWRLGLRRALALPEKSARLGALRSLAGSASFDALGPISLDLLGRALRDAGDPVGAESVLRRAQRRHPGDVWINYDLALALRGLSRRDEAIRYATAARSIRPETAHELAHMLADRGESEEGIAVFEDLRRLRPGNGRHLGCLALALRRKGRSREAAAILAEAEAVNREAVRLRPDDAHAHASLAFVLSAQEKYDEAIAEYRAASRIRPDEVNYHTGLGRALGFRKKLDEAMAEFRVALRIDPDDANTHGVLGWLLRQVKRDPLAAASEFREAIRLRPDDATYHAELGRTLRGLMMLDEAIAEYRIAERLQPDSYSAAGNRVNLGIILEQLGKLDEAIVEYRAAVRLDPEYPEAKNDLAWALCKKRDVPAPERAELLARAREAVALAAKDGNVVNTLALAEYRAGNWSESIAAAERSIALIQGLATFDWLGADEHSIKGLNAADPSNWFFLAMAHWQRGEKDRARANFGRAVAWTKAKNPTNIELLQFWRESAALLGEPGPGLALPPEPSAGGASQ